MNIPVEKQKEFIKDFEKSRPDYVEFAGLLEEILKKAADQFGYLALIQARAKNILSFSNKIIMKDKYKNPLAEVTDLCGARVIVHFQSQAARICDFIKENFSIDEANSLDVKSRLKVNEFGYRSIHYIVTPKKDSILGIPVNDKFKKLKAEIQVRTLAEHLWADISHDRIYKTELTIPEEWKREAARLSAILENADITFAAMSQSIDAVSNVFELQYKTGDAETDIQKLNTLIEILKDDVTAGVKNVLNLVSVYRALNMIKEARFLLGEWLGKLPEESFWHFRLHLEQVFFELAGCLSGLDSDDYRKFINLANKLLKNIELLQKDKPALSSSELSSLYYRYGCFLQGSHEKPNEALNAINRALELMPENPFYLTSLAECMVLRNIDMAHRTMSLFKTTLLKNISDLEGLISLGIDGIAAWFAVGRCHFFLGNEKECINAYSNAVAIILNKKFTSCIRLIDAEIARAGRFNPYDPLLAEQIRMYLIIALSVSEKSNKRDRYVDLLLEGQKRLGLMKRPLIIVAGGAGLMDGIKTQSYIEYIEELMLGFKGTIISGGTDVGIPGLAGKVKDKMKNKTGVEFDLLAYLPEKLPADAVRSEAYDHIYSTNSNKFSALDILTCWSDIILSKINPVDVILIGIDGGEIAAMEYRIALSLGARVCLAAYSGRAVNNFVNEKQWKSDPNLILLPSDPLTVWALVNRTVNSILTVGEAKELAPLVHEFYREDKLKDFIPTEPDINKYKVVMRWEKLDPVLRESNIQHVLFLPHILNRVNLGISKSDKPKGINIKEILSGDLYEFLARLEHARWNAEQLLEGWKYGPEKDLAKKLNPNIVAWEKLDETTKAIEYKSIDNIPELLQKIGYEVYQI